MTGRGTTDATMGEVVPHEGTAHPVVDSTSEAEADGRMAIITGWAFLGMGVIMMGMA
jgi:hypothetical protein